MLTKVQLAPTPEELAEVAEIEAKIDNDLKQYWVEGKQVEVWASQTSQRVAAEVCRIYTVGGWKITTRDTGDQRGWNTVFALE